MKVVCVGDCGVDHYLPSGELRFGGITANFARHAIREFRADDEIHIVSCIGDDDGASLVRSSLTDTGIDCRISTIPGTTSTQYIELEANGERNFVRYDAGVLSDFVFSKEQRDIIAGSELLVAPVYVQIIDLFNELLTIGTSGLTAIDFADFQQHPDFALLEDNIDKVDIAFFGLSVDDAATVEKIASLAATHNKLFVTTLGANGSRAFHGTRQFQGDAVPVAEVVDTTGAGDAFAAGFLSRYCHGASVETAMQHGAQLAANTVARLGG